MIAPAEEDAYELPPWLHKQIFDEQIRPTLTGVPRDRPGEQPTLIAIGGQQGSGKNTVHEAVLAQLGLEHAVLTDGDLNHYHPQYRQLMQHDDRAAAYVLAYAGTLEWFNAALAHVRKERYDVAIPAPFRNNDWTHQTLADFRNAGYRIEMVFLAVHEAHSLMGIVDRYQRGREETGVGTWVGPESHDYAYPSVLDTADWVDTSRSADVASVALRDGKIVYRNHLIDDRWEHPPATRQAIQTERERPWTREQSDQFLIGAARLYNRVPEAVKVVVADALARGLAHLKAANSGLAPTSVDLAASAYPARPSTSSRSSSGEQAPGRQTHHTQTDRAALPGHNSPSR